MPTVSERLSPLSLNKESWVCSWYDPTGKRRWRSFGNVKRVGKRQAERLYAEFAVKWQVDAGVRDPDARDEVPEQLTVAELTERYLEYAEAYYTKPSGRRTSHASNMDHAMRPMIKVCGRKLVSQVLATDLRAARDLMLDKDLSRVTINERVNRIRHVFKWGVGRDTVPPEVLQKLQAVEPLRRGRSGVKEGKGRRTLHPNEVEAPLPYMPDPVAAMVRLQWLTGMRPGEVMSMRGCDLDTSGKVWVLYRPAEHKTEHHGKSRAVFLGPQAQQVVAPFLKRRLDEHLFSPRDAIVDREAARGGSKTDKGTRTRYALHGTRYMAGSYRQAIHRACAKAGVEPWAPYDLRHTAATRLRREHGEEAARVVLGHSRIDTTQMYGEVDQTKAIAVAAASG